MEFNREERFNEIVNEMFGKELRPMVKELNGLKIDIGNLEKNLSPAKNSLNRMRTILTKIYKEVKSANILLDRAWEKYGAESEEVKKNQAVISELEIKEAEAAAKHAIKKDLVIKLELELKAKKNRYEELREVHSSLKSRAIYEAGRKLELEAREFESKKSEEREI